MTQLLTTFACVMTAGWLGAGIPGASAALETRLAGQGQVGAQATWTSFVGRWNGDPAVNTPSPTSPLALVIAIVGDELTIERRAISAETSRYRLDGRPARTVHNGRPADATAVIEDGTLVIKAQLTLPGGQSSTITETYWVGRNLMTIDRTTSLGTQTTKTEEVFQRIADNVQLHGGVELR